MSRDQASGESVPDGSESCGARGSSSALRSDGGTTVGEGGPVADEAGATGGVVREIGHEEFDPVGTLALILVYLAILVVMWIFMYFVEFLGNGPTVVG